MTLELPISTDRLVLRAYRTEDTGAFHAIYSQPEVARYLLDEPWTPEVARAKIAERILRTGLDSDAHMLGLVIELDGAAIGDVMIWLTDVERGVAEIGWALDPAFGGKGYAREAAAALLDVAFDVYELHRVAAQLDPRNVASAKLAEGLGMHREAHLRQNWWSKGEWTDTVVYGMLASDREIGSRAQ